MVSMLALSTDEKVQRDVLDELHWDPQIKDMDIGVEIDDGVVTLLGFVSDCRKRRLAAEAALRVYGVRGLVNDIEVKTASSYERSDTDIALAAGQAIEWDATIPDGRVEVRCSGAWIILEGTVDYFFQKRAAEYAVEGLVGVRGVTNLIQIEPEETPSLPFERQDQIERAFARNAEIDARRITVSVDDSHVTLSGNVRSWAESHEAAATAWSTPGVKSVVNDLNVQP
ncbi:MAG TPA: BON domain-containing protein [Chloroflexota bacterium]